MDTTFPRKEKLKSKKLIETVFSDGSAVSKYPLKLIYVQKTLPEKVMLQVAVSVPKRRFRKAVDRNRIKRLMRESWRLQKTTWLTDLEKPYAFVFIYTGKDRPEFQELSKKMKTLREKFMEHINN